jgi:hypothetical protein
VHWSKPSNEPSRPNSPVPSSKCRAFHQSIRLLHHRLQWQSSDRPSDTFARQRSLRRLLNPARLIPHRLPRCRARLIGWKPKAIHAARNLRPQLQSLMWHP